MQLVAATFPDMGIVEKIHYLKQGHRPHFIQEWAKARRLEQKDIVSELDVDKSVVSRWFSGSTPSVKYQEALANLFETEREGLFRHPAEVWLATFMSGRSPEEVDRIKAMLEAGFPKRPSLKN
jgi:transcriptional regulator with XRE-family HTH domain